MPSVRSWMSRIQRNTLSEVKKPGTPRCRASHFDLLRIWPSGPSYQPVGVMMISTRRFWARPSEVRLLATG